MLQSLFVQCTFYYCPTSSVDGLREVERGGERMRDESDFEIKDTIACFMYLDVLTVLIELFP